MHLTGHVYKKLKSRDETERLNGKTSTTDVSRVSVSCLPLARPADSRRTNVSRRIPNSDFMAVTSFDGQRVYVTMKTEGSVQRQVISLLFLITHMQFQHVCLFVVFCLPFLENHMSIFQETFCTNYMWPWQYNTLCIFGFCVLPADLSPLAVVSALVHRKCYVCITHDSLCP